MRPIVRAGTRKLITKTGKRAITCCEQIFVPLFWQQKPSAVTFATSVMSFDRLTLLPFWVRDCVSQDMIDPYYDGVLYHAARQVRVTNNQIIHCHKNTSLHKKSTFIHDLGFNRQFAIGNLDNYMAVDAFSICPSGHIFVVEREDIPASTSRVISLTCYTPTGGVTSRISYTKFEIVTMNVQVESNRLLLFLGGFYWDIADPDIDRIDGVICVSFNGTTFSEEWRWIDDDPINLVPDTGRGYEIYCPRSEGTCCLQSMIYEQDEHDSPVKTVCRFSTLKNGARINKWDITMATHAGDPSPYGTRDFFPAAGSFGFKPEEVPQCALLHRGKVDYLFVRAYSDLKPSLMYQLNLTDGTTDEVAALTLPAEMKPQLCGINSSKRHIDNYANLLSYDVERMYITSMSNLGTSIASASRATHTVLRQDAAGSLPYFIAARTNREIKFEM